MEKRAEISGEPPEQAITPPSDERLLPPAQSHTSMVLNGMGNGMMLGAVPFVAMESWGAITGKQLTKGQRKGSIFATVAGCALGMWYGTHEARNLERYRFTIGSELESLRDKSQQQEQKIVKLTQALDAQNAEKSVTAR